VAVETVEQKAQRYVAEGRVRPARGCYRVVGGTGTWTVTKRPNGDLRCDCPVMAKTMCSHRLAVEMFREYQAKAKEAEKMAKDVTTQMVTALQTMAMAPSMARETPTDSEIDCIWRICEMLARTAAFSKNVKRWNPTTKTNDWIAEPGDPYEVFSVCLAGRDFNLSEAESARHLKMIKGALSISAEIMRARLHQFGYEYKLLPVERDAKGVPVSITMQLWRARDPKTVWDATYTMKDAQTAELIKDGGGWTKNPEDMLVARVTTRCVRRYAPEVLNKTYALEELGFYEEDDGQGGMRILSVTDDDDAIEGSMENADDHPVAAAPVPEKAAKPKPTPAAAPAPPPAKDGGVIEGDFEFENQEAGEVSALTEDDASEPDLPAEEGPEFDPDAVVTAREGVPQDVLLYDDDGNPANELTRRYDAGLDPEPEPEATAAAAPESAPTWTAEDDKHVVNTGALRKYLTDNGMTGDDQVALLNKCAPGKKWPMLGPDERVMLYTAARDGV
jgi:hypothetical protein